MVSPNWGLLQPNQSVKYFDYGMRLGQAARERQDANELRKAEATLFANPNDQNALAAYAQLNPKGAFQYRQGQQKAEQDTQEKALIGRAAQGDEAAMLALWGVNYDAASKLDETSKKNALAGINYISEAAFQIVQLPPEQRPAAWDAYIDQAAGRFPGLMQYKGKYSEESLNSIVAQAGKTKDFQQFQQPRYIPVGEQGLQGLQYGRPMEGGRMLAPQAPAQQGNIPTVRTPEEASKLPPGTQFYDPNGVLRTVPGGAGSNTSGGFPR